MKFYDLKRRKQISLFTAGSNGPKKVDANSREEVSQSHDNSANLICFLGATSNPSPSVAVKSTLKHTHKTKSGNNNKGVSSNILNANGLYGSGPLPPLSSLTTTTDSLSSGRSSSSDSESGRNVSECYES